MTIESMFAALRRKLFKEIDRRCEHAKGDRPQSTVNRSVGQLYRRPPNEADTIQGANNRERK